MHSNGILPDPRPYLGVGGSSGGAPYMALQTPSLSGRAGAGPPYEWTQRPTLGVCGLDLNIRACMTVGYDCLSLNLTSPQMKMSMNSSCTLDVIQVALDKSF